MIAAFNRKSLALGIPGIVLQIGGFVMILCAGKPGEPSARPVVGMLGLLVLLAGTVLLLLGLAYYAKAKGRSPAWCLMGFASWIGLIVLAMLKDLTPPEVPNAEEASLPVRTSRLAQASFVVSLIGVLCIVVGGVVAIILGILALMKIAKDPTLKGSGLAIAGIVLGALELVGFSIYFLVLAASM